MIHVWQYLTQYRYVSDSVAGTLLFGIVIVLTLFVIGVWFRQSVLSKSAVICVALVVPIVTVILLVIPSAYRGTPDMNCDKYENGKLVFVLEGATIRPEKPDDPYGAEVLALVVRAPKRWGGELHLCVVPRNSEKAKSIIDFLQGFGFEPGVTTIVFGGEQERPNVTWSPKGPLDFKKPGPPEAS